MLFIKMNGLGNDYVFIDAEAVPENALKYLETNIKRLAPKTSGAFPQVFRRKPCKSRGSYSAGADISLSMAAIFSPSRFNSSLSLSIFFFISSSSELPFLELHVKKPRLFS